MALTSSAGPFYAKDSNGTLQKIKVVNIQNGDGTEDDLIAGYSYVDATGSLQEHIEKISSALEKTTFKTADVIKKYFSNNDKGQKYKLIDWDSNNSGTFRMCVFNPERKGVSVYNDSNKDLFISCDIDYNPEIQIDFENIEDIEYLNVDYKFYDGSKIITLFNYNINDLKNIHSYHTFSGDSAKYGCGKYCIIQKNINNYSLNIYLTPDFYSQNLNRDLDTLSYSTGSYEIYLSSSDNGILSDIHTVDLISNLDNPLYENLQYKIYTKLSGTHFIDSSFITASSQNNLINSFDLSSISDPSQPDAAPENYSYIVFANESLFLTNKEATLPVFGYLIKPDPDENLIIRVTETI